MRTNPARTIVMVTVAIGGLSCQSSRGHVCDGSTSLRLGIARLSPSGQAFPGRKVMLDNGSSFLYVDGTCRYWTQAGDLWAGTHSGVLTPAQASQLEADVHYADWSSGNWQAEGLFDGSVLLLYDTSVQLSCSSFCDRTSAPDFLKGVAAQFDDLVRPLWNAGAAMDGEGVRIIVVHMDPGTFDSVPHAAWPLAVPVQTIAEDFGTASTEGYGHGTLFLGADAQRLRALRTMYQAGNYQNLGVLGLPVDGAGGEVYELFIRDALPFEDSAGLVRPAF